MTSIPRQKGEEILCYFTSHKFIIACKSQLLFFFAPILILDVLKWFCASDHREEFNLFCFFPKSVPPLLFFIHIRFYFFMLCLDEFLTKIPPLPNLSVVIIEVGCGMVFDKFFEETLHITVFFR